MTNFYEKWFGKQKCLSEGYLSIIFENIDVSEITGNFFHEIWTAIDYYSTARSESLHEREKSDSLSDADFEGEKVEFFSQKAFRFDPSVLNDSKQISNNCFGSEKLFIIKQKRSYIDSHK